MASSNFLLEVSNLSVKLKDEVILDKISFKARKGSTTAIVGPNGAGKTTLFKALLNLVPYSGKIKWHKKIKIGYVPQNLSVSDMPISVKEFLLLKNCSTDDMEECLSRVGLEGEEIIDKRLDSLSGGELQKVLIAWAISDKPDLLLFDEPTTGVDVGSEELIYEMLAKLEKETKMTMLLITHNVHSIKYYSDYVLALDKSVLFFGESKKITEPHLIKAVYGSHSLFDEHSHEDDR